MVTGIVLIHVDRPKLKSVIDALLEIQGITEVYTVAGDYDLVAMIRVADNLQLSDIVATKMTRDIEGIQHTKTLVTLSSHSHVDLKALFQV